MRLERGGPIQTFYIGNKKMPVVERGEGVYLYDEEGKKYFDASSGPITCNIGHANPKVCLLYTSPSPRDLVISRMPSSA